MARKQKEKSQQTKDELLESAESLISKKGFSAATIAEITDSAGYAKGNFYRYWKSKDDLILSIMEKKFRAYRGERDAVLKKAQTMDDVMTAILDFLESMIDDENWAKIFLEFTIHASGSQRLKKELNQGLYRLSTDLFAEIVHNRKSSHFSSRKVGALVIALFEGFLIQTLLGTGVLTKEDLKKSILLIADFKDD